MKTTDKIQAVLQNYLFEEATVFLLVINQAGEILDSNEYTRRLVGRELKGGTIKDVFVDFTMAVDLPTLIHESGKTHLLNVTTFTGLPESLYCHFYLVDNQILILGKLDVIGLETMRKEIVTLNNELAVMTRELHKTNSRLTRLNTLKNQFLGMAAHDLRHPISAILSYSEFLIDETTDLLDEQQQNLLKTINSSGWFMSGIINDFLDVALIEAGRFNIAAVPGNLNQVIAENLLFHKIMAAKHHVAFSFSPDEALPIFPFDQSKIEQVLNNLVLNAMEYAPQNTVIHIATTGTAETVTVSVTNDGPGIPEAVQKNLFQLFGKGDAAKQMDKKSIGLGLAISRMIVEAHHGHIWAESQPGQGATFKFSLPVNVN